MDRRQGLFYVVLASKATFAKYNAVNVPACTNTAKIAL